MYLLYIYFFLEVSHWFNMRQYWSQLLSFDLTMSNIPLSYSVARSILVDA
jgi:hypothetical protein